MKTAVLLVLAAALLSAPVDGIAGKVSTDGYVVERTELEVFGEDFVESLDMIFRVRSGGRLSLGTTHGSVNVMTWQREEVRLVLTKRTRAASADDARRILEQFRVQARHGGGNLALRARARTAECAGSVGVDFTIWVPKSYSLDIKTDNGDIELPGVDGKFSARTGDGAIRVDCPPEDLEVEVEDERRDRRDGDVQPEAPENGDGKL